MQKHFWAMWNLLKQVIGSGRGCLLYPQISPTLTAKLAPFFPKNYESYLLLCGCRSQSEADFYTVAPYQRLSREELAFFPQINFMHLLLRQ